MAVMRQRRPEETIVSSGNDAKRTLADVIKVVDTPGAVVTPVAYSTVAADLAAALVNAGLMQAGP